MGGGHNDESVPPRCRCPDDVAIVLVGKVGSGKSATGNSILGWDAFKSEHSCTSVTETCQMHSRTFRYGSSETRISVIDTPGLFDMDTDVEDASKEIAKCMDLSKDGIHAMLMVFSASTRFAREDVNTVESIITFFGGNIADHMILVFTNGDQVDENTLKKMLSDKRAAYLQKLVKLCADRVVLFDNKTKDEVLQKEQLKELLRAVNSVISNANGVPFSNKMFNQIKEVHEEMFKSKKDIYDGYLMLITKMVEDKLNSTIEKIQNQLMEEQKARQKMEKEVEEVKLRAEEEIRQLRERLEKAERERCTIM